MATSLSPSQPASLTGEINHYLSPVNLNDILPINVGLHSAQEATMISMLGSPLMPLTTVDQPARVSPLVKRLLQTAQISENIGVTGIRPAIENIKNILLKAFTLQAAEGHNLESVLLSHDMLNVRLRKPTSGRPSTKISNHAWGTAIDLKIVHSDFLGNTGHTVPKFIAVLVPLFNEAGWYSGIAFHDTMHFEVAEETINKWLQEGRFNP